jgi:hypothetical protein
MTNFVIYGYRTLFGSTPVLVEEFLWPFKL